MINVFMMNTKAEGASGGDPFWDDATRLLLSALSFLLIETGMEEEQNFAGVLDLIHKATVLCVVMLAVTVAKASEITKRALGG